MSMIKGDRFLFFILLRFWSNVFVGSGVPKILRLEPTSGLREAERVRVDRRDTTLSHTPPLKMSTSDTPDSRTQVYGRDRKGRLSGTCPMSGKDKEGKGVDMSHCYY